jgi:hypothetical protein
MTAKSKAALAADLAAELPTKGVGGSYYRTLSKIKAWLTDLLDSVNNEDDAPSVKASEPLVRAVSASLAHDSAASVDVGDALPAGSRVVGYAARVDETFNGTAPTVTVGDGTTADAVMADDALDLGGAAGSGASALIVPVDYAAETQLIATYVADGSEAGAAEITIFYV